MTADLVPTTEICEVPASHGEVVDVAPPLPPLTAKEDMFALAVIEYGGNLRKAYEEAFGVGDTTPVAKARALIARPEIALRIRDITESVQENALVSLGSHLVELADIRDLAKYQGQLKVALNAEEARGRVAGLYIGKEGAGTKNGSGAGTSNPMVMISITTHQDANI
jgi:hypothetical protein